MPTLKAKIITAAALAVILCGLLAIIYAMNQRIGRLQTELKSQQAATASAQAALDVESAAYANYRAAAATLNQQLTVQIKANTDAAAALAAALEKSPEWSAVALPPEVAATINKGQ